MTEQSQQPEENNEAAQKEAAKPVMHPFFASILTIVVLVIGFVVGTYLGYLIDSRLSIFTGLASVFITIPIAGRLFGTKDKSSDGKTKYRADHGIAKAASVGFVVFGLVIGLLIGGIINFGACYKSECSALEAGAPIYIPLASLLITVPAAVRAFNPKEKQASQTKRTEVEAAADRSEEVEGEVPAEDTGAEVRKNDRKPFKTFVVLSIAFFTVVGIGLLASRLSQVSEEEKIDLRSSSASSDIDTELSAFRRGFPSNEATYFAEGERDVCFERNVGDKWSANYVTVCSYRKTQFYGFDNHSETLLEIEQTLLDEGWEPTLNIRSISSKLNPANQTSVESQLNPDVDLIDFVSYRKDGFKLSIADEQRDTGLSFDFKNAQKIGSATNSPEIRSSDLRGIGPVTDQIFSQFEFAIAVSIEKEYYQSN